MILISRFVSSGVTLKQNGIEERWDNGDGDAIENSLRGTKTTSTRLKVENALYVNTGDNKRDRDGRIQKANLQAPYRVARLEALISLFARFVDVFSFFDLDGTSLCGC